MADALGPAWAPAVACSIIILAFGAHALLQLGPPVPVAPVRLVRAPAAVVVVSGLAEGAEARGVVRHVGASDHPVVVWVLRLEPLVRVDGAGALLLEMERLRKEEEPSEKTESRHFGGVFVFIIRIPF